MYDIFLVQQELENNDRSIYENTHNSTRAYDLVESHDSITMSMIESKLVGSIKTRDRHWA